MTNQPAIPITWHRVPGGWIMRTTAAPSGWRSTYVNLVLVNVADKTIQFWDHKLSWVGRRHYEGEITKQMRDSLMAEWLMDYGRTLGLHHD